MELRNKTIVLTGPSSGVGLEILRLLGADNAIIGLSRRPPPDDAVASAENYTHITLDLADGGAVASAISQIRQSHPDGIDGLINCAAIQFTPRFCDADFDPRSIAQEIAINLTSPIELTAGLLGLLGKADAPFIMNVSSGLAIAPKSQSAVYCATKAGLSNFTAGLRAQLADTPIAVQQAFLPIVDTPMTEGRGRAKLSAQSVAQQIVASIESGRPDTDIGKVKLLRFINRLSPTVANRIMQRGDA